MLFTRTIRRKMVCGFAVVLVMLLTLSLSGLSGLMSYRQAVQELEYSITDAPQRVDLTAAVSQIDAPLKFATPIALEGAALQQTAFLEKLDLAKNQITRFRKLLDDVPAENIVPQQRLVSETYLNTLDEHIADLEKLQTGLLDLPNHEQVKQRMNFHLGQLERLVEPQRLRDAIPDYHEGPEDTLTRARGVYRSRLAVVSFTSTVAIVLFLALVRYGYVTIFSPLRKLHQGALRVAHGDFDYRLKLRTNDEMGELADSFNRMTERFQEITRDLDRRVRERTKQLLRTERLAGIGFLAAGVAHEINNPLQAIGMAGESLLGRTEELLSDLDEADRDLFRQYLGMIQSEADRCQQITRKLLDFARGQDASRDRHDITQIIFEVLGMIQHMSKYSDRAIELKRSEPCYAVVNGPEIKQVVLNIVSNALESMEPGGTLRIDLKEETDDVIVKFEDEGCGMTTETVENLFEPFFTRRKDGKGTGLGMCISQRIIGDHGGTIEAASDGPGCGSRFRVQIPRKPSGKQAA